METKPTYEELEQEVKELKKELLEFKRTEMELRESEERFNLAIRSTLDGIWDWNILTNEEYFTPRWCEILGYSYDDPELLHTYDSWASRMHPDDYERTMDALKAHLEEGKTYNVDYRHRHKSGEYRWQNSRGQAIFDENGKPVRMVGCIRNITERKQAEEVLRRERDKLEVALAEVKTLSGMLSICSYCKNVREDDGYWNKIETYIGEQTGADFSHGICPECADKFYPEYDLYGGRDDM